tara:strand:+ start:41 stop:382 length:342 start_codon:yes stop_codon:yes gene_type:complete
MSDKNNPRECSTLCVRKNVSCPVMDCKHWIEHEDDLNCVLVAIEKHGSMTLREIADRMHLSFVRVKQIQDKAIQKISANKSNEDFDLKLFEDYIKEGNNFLSEDSKNKELFED